MNPKIILPAVLLATAAAGTGYYLGSRATPSPAGASHPSGAAEKLTAAPLPRPPAADAPLKRLD
ncbi:MAG: hypothetical protein QG602_2023, partial [Verrucomicrobiota bacterium]|nr:hypothetical protein [Verrucomicrobiota bacterium]